MVIDHWITCLVVIGHWINVVVVIDHWITCWGGYRPLDNVLGWLYTLDNMLGGYRPLDNVPGWL